MIFLCHLIYTVVFVGYILSLSPPKMEEYVLLSKRKKKHYTNAPYVSIVFFYLFVVMNYVIQTKNPDAFAGKLGEQLLAATFGSVMIWANIKERKLLPKKILWILPVAYFIHTLVRNWAVMKSVFYIFEFLLREVGSLVVLIFFCVFPSALVDMTTPLTAEDEEELRQDVEAYNIQRKEEKERKRQEEERRFQEKMRALRQQQNDSSDDEESYVDRHLRGMEEKGSANHYTNSNHTCSKCSYYQGGKCQHAFSENYDREIWNPGSTNCGHYSRR